MKEKIKYWDKPFITAKTVVAVKNFVLCPWCENPRGKDTCVSDGGCQHSIHLS